MSTVYELLDRDESPAMRSCPSCGQVLSVLAWHDRHVADVQDVCRIVGDQPGILRGELRQALHEAWGRPKPTRHARATAAINDAQALGWIRVEPEGPGLAIRHYPVGSDG
jgi:hypothetical protein